jgi:hypothetical protein
MPEDRSMDEAEKIREKRGVDNDVEGHRRNREGLTEEDVEGHARRVGETEDDVEGHKIKK